MKIRFAVMMMMAAAVWCFGADKTADAQTLDIASIYKSPISTPEGTGMIDAIVKEAFSRIGVKINIIPAESATALEKVNKGIYDGDIMRVGGAEAKFPNIIPIPESFYNYEFVAFTKDVNETMTGYDGLKPYRVAVPKGWVETDNNVRDDNTKSVDRITSPFEMFNTLMKGESDIVIYNRLMGYEIVKETGMTVRALEPPLASKPVFLYLHNSHKDMAPKLAAAFSDMKKDGTLKRIIDETMSRYKN